jgi:hypothetical protein
MQGNDSLVHKNVGVKTVATLGHKWGLQPPAAVVSASVGPSGSSVSTHRVPTPPQSGSGNCYRCGEAGHHVAAHNNLKSPLYMSAMQASKSDAGDGHVEMHSAYVVNKSGNEMAGPEGL